MKEINPENDLIIEYDQQHEHAEQGIVVPFERINPDTLYKMAEEFVTRDWSELTDVDCSLDDKVKQVLQQLKDNRAKVVYDLTTESCNIVPDDSKRR